MQYTVIKKLYVVIDPCHLLKCIRNSWLDKQSFLINGKSISLEHIRQL